jgi:protein involved in polysaccharide export with SLBB domain
LYEAGGLTAQGNFRTVEVRRGRELVAAVDLYEYLLRGVTDNNLRLEPGDVVFVPVHGPRVKIAGEVVRPAIYELKRGESLQDLVGIAGGLTPYAATEAVTIDRVLPPEQRPEAGHVRTVLTASLGDSEDTVAVSLLPADSITILAVRGGRRNAVTISGSVWQPGTFRLDVGMRLWDLIRAAGGLRPDTYEGRAQIVRVDPDSTRQMFGFFLDTNGNPAPATNPVLQEGDQVTIFSRIDFRPLRFVTVEGAVGKPGPVAFSDSMTLRDAILLAQGLTDDAYLLEAEVSRLPPDQDQSESRAPPNSSSILTTTSSFVGSLAGGCSGTS